jgi:prolyl-tRNA editing enzyme YbaK/EbsC (Cys-tRNA(Pro) deacylase)
VIVDTALLDHAVVSLGGGAHGVSVKIDPSAIVRALEAEVADVTAVL